MDGFYGINESRENLAASGDKALKMSRKVNIYFILKMTAIFFNIINIGLSNLVRTAGVGETAYKVFYYSTVGLLLAGVVTVFLMSSYSKIFIASAAVSLADIGLSFIDIPDTTAFKLLDAGITILCLCLFSKAMENSLKEVGSDLGNRWKYLAISLFATFIVVGIACGLGFSGSQGALLLALVMLVLALVVILGASIYYLYLLKRTANEFRDCAY